jgi:hypothetical protein
MSFLHDYLSMWLLYLAASLAASVIVGRLLRPLRSVFARQSVLAVVMLLLLMPAQVDPNQPYLAPALMAGLLDALSLGTDAAITRLIPLMMAVVVMVLVIVIMALWRLRSRKKA